MADSVLPNGVTPAKRTCRVGSAFPPTTGNIAAIDFGTVNVSVSYATAHDDTIRLHHFKGGDTRVPTALLVDPHGKKGSFGKSATSNFNRNLDEDEKMDWHFFQYVKLSLSPEEVVRKDTTVKSINGVEFYLRDVLALMLSLIKKDFEHSLQFSTLTYTPNVDDFYWVITVPNIWNAAGKQMMREAAYLAGLGSGESRIFELKPARETYLNKVEIQFNKSLSLVLEPEAAALYCTTLTHNEIADYAKTRSITTRTKQNYLILDIGGGTVDITAHSQDINGVEILTTPKGNMLGGTEINRCFEKFLADLVKDPGFESYIEACADAKPNLHYIMYEMFEEQKHEFGRTYRNSAQGEESSEMVVNLHPDFTSVYQKELDSLCCKNVTYKRNRLRIKREEMKRFFDESTHDMLDIIRTILQKSDRPIETIYLVGGFGGCSYIYHRITEELERAFPSKRFSLVPPAKHDLAVVYGALQYRKNPEIIQSRKAAWTIGTDCMIDFDETKHDTRYKKIESGKLKCDSLFMPFVTIGEVLKSDEVKVASFKPARKDQTSMYFGLYSTTKNKVFYTHTPEPNSTLISDLKQIGSLEISISGYGLDRPVLVTMDYGQTEIHVHGKEQKTGNVVNVVVDFL